MTKPRRPKVQTPAAPIAKLLYPVREVAGLLSVPLSRLYEMKDDGHVVFLKLGHRSMIEHAALMKLLERIRAGKVEGRPTRYKTVEPKVAA